MWLYLNVALSECGYVSLNVAMVCCMWLCLNKLCSDVAQFKYNIILKIYLEDMLYLDRTDFEMFEYGVY